MVEFEPEVYQQLREAKRQLMTKKLQKWEYMVQHAFVVRESDLNRWGADGWELVTIIPTEGDAFYYFKRPISEPKP